VTDPAATAPQRTGCFGRTAAGWSGDEPAVHSALDTLSEADPRLEVGVLEECRKDSVSFPVARSEGTCEDEGVPDVPRWETHRDAWIEGVRQDLDVRATDRSHGSRHGVAGYEHEV
jgi:hypothetical protein